MRGLGFLAPWVVLLPREPQLFEQALPGSALKEENERQQDEVEEQGNVKQRCV